MNNIEEYNEIMNDLYTSLSRYFGIRPMELNHFSIQHIEGLIKHQDTITHCSLLTTDSVEAKEYAEEYTLLVRFKPNQNNHQNKSRIISPDMYKYSDSDDPEVEVYTKEDKSGRSFKQSKSNDKFVLEFDEPPALVFVSHDSRNEEVYMNGQRIRDWTALKIDSAIDKYTEYDLSLVSIKSKEERK